MIALELLRLILAGLVLLGCVAHSFSQTPKGIGEFPDLRFLECNPDNEEYLRTQINVSNLLWLAYHNDSIFFYFKEIVILSDAPMLRQMTDDADELQGAYLLTLKPARVALHERRMVPSFLRAYGDRTIGNLQAVEAHGTRTFLLSLSPSNETKVHHIELDEEDVHFGQFPPHKNEKRYEDLIRKGGEGAKIKGLKEELNFLSIWYDFLKVVIVKSTINTVEFTFYNAEEDLYNSFQKQAKVERSKSYITIKHSTYYEPNDLPYKIRREYAKSPIPDDLYRFWAGIVLEVDVQNVLHLHSYMFTLDLDTQVLKITSHHRIDMPLHNFFQCQKRLASDRLETRNQLKGLIFNKGSATRTPSKTDRTWLFIDHYYVLFRVDLISVEFNLHNFRRGSKVGRVESSYLTKRPREALSMKYVKHYRGKSGLEYHFTFNDKESFQLLKPGDLLFAPDDPLKLKLDGYSMAHTCPHSTATLAGVTSCWGRQFYWPMFTGDLTSPLDYTRKKSITILLLPLNVDYDDEDIELVFHYQDKIVFMTYSWLLILNETLFRVDHPKYPTEYSVDIQIVEKHHFELPLDLLEKRRNCLWRSCAKEQPVHREKPAIRRPGDNLSKMDPNLHVKKEASLVLLLHMALNVILLVIIVSLFTVIHKMSSKGAALSKVSQIDSQTPSRFPTIISSTSSMLNDSKMSKMSKMNVSELSQTKMNVSELSQTKMNRRKMNQSNVNQGKTNQYKTDQSIDQSRTKGRLNEKKVNRRETNPNRVTRSEINQSNVSNESFKAVSSARPRSSSIGTSPTYLTSPMFLSKKSPSSSD